ncbi:MAG: linear amide C-N hydrolase [Lacticaseibacillus paracasei]
MCSSMTIKSLQGDIFWGRTMDYNTSFFHESPVGGVPGKIVSLPGNKALPTQSAKWITKYAAVGVGIDQSTALFDGVNSEGLAGDLQVLVECSWASADSLKQRGLKAIKGEEFVTLALTTCKNVDEVRALAGEYGLLDEPYEFGGQGVKIPLHYTFVDPSGKGIVVEPTDHGAFKLYDSIGAMTNSPEYGWHETNLRNYVSLNDNNYPKGSELGDYHIEPIELGTGYGMFGLPGDYTSPSRFLRAMFVSRNLDPFNSKDGIRVLYNALKTVLIPQGLGRDPQHQVLTDYTQYWSGYDLTKKTIFVQDSDTLTMTTKTLDPTITDVTYEDLAKTEQFNQL